MKISKKIHTQNAVSEIMRAVFSKVVISLHFLITNSSFKYFCILQRQQVDVKYATLVLSYFSDFFNSFELIHNFTVKLKNKLTIYFLFILKIEVMVSIPAGHTLWQDSAFEQPAPKCSLYSLIT